MDQFFSTVITSALVATIAGAAINAWWETRKDKHNTRFDALTAAISLEGYAIDCADRIFDNDLAEQSGGHAGAFMGSVPELPNLSIPAGFLRPKKAEVADRLMIFPQEIRQADQVAAFQWDVTADISAVRETAVAQSAKVGLKALDLAADLRKAFKLPNRTLVFGIFDVRKTLENNLRKDQYDA